jgi:glutamine synthetase adenylyltransferase
VAGDEGLGRRFCSFASDFAYPDYLPVERVGEIRRMRERIERERVRPPEASRFHFKLGYGSLADVQFAVELSLMRFGGRHPRSEPTGRSTRSSGSRASADRGRAARRSSEAFVFLSDVKDALEVDRRVHAEAIPPAPQEQLALARRLGFEEYPRQTLLEEYRRITRRARRAMERVFYEEEDDVPRRLIASGSPFEPVIGFSRAVVEGHHVLVAGTAPIMPDGGDPPADAFGQTARCSRSSWRRSPRRAPVPSTSCGRGPT